MAIVRWNPYTDVETLRNQFDRMFQELTDWNTVPNRTNWQPALELVDGGDYLNLKLQLPGWKADDLDISVSRDSVLIKGEKSHKEEKSEANVYYSEFNYDRFQRTVKLPVPVKNNEVAAQFNDGILTLNLPKVEEVINRVVKVNLGENKEAAN